MPTTGNRLKKLRKENNYTKESLAEFLDLQVDDITRLETNEQKLTVSKLERLCNLYCVDEEYIIENKHTSTSREDYDMENLDFLNLAYIQVLHH